MTDRHRQQNELIRQEFTRQAEAYAGNPTIVDPEWAARLVEAAAPAPDNRVLEIATGPGYVAMAFAPHVQHVVGVDLTAAALANAEATRQARGLENVEFVEGDAGALDFPPTTFDIVVCRLAFHHFAAPEQILAEMARVCRPGGCVVVEDLVSSENALRAAYYNRWEQLRDPSHVRALSISELIGAFAGAGLEVVRVQTEDRRQEADQWLRNAHTPAAAAAQVRALLADDRAQTLSGLRLYREKGGALCFDHRMATVVGVNI